MQGEFEKKIQEQMQQFNLEPSPQVWNDVASALQEKKRRRFVIWWWLLPVLLAGSAGVWYFGFDSANENETAKNTETVNNKNAAKTEHENLYDTSLLPGKKIISPGENKLSQPKENLKNQITSKNENELVRDGMNKKKGITDEKITAGIIANNGNKQSNENGKDVTVQKVEQPASDIKTQNNAAAQNEKEELLPVNADSAVISKQNVVKESGEKKIAFDSSLKTNIAKKEDSKVKRKGSWYVNIAGGISSTNETKLFQSNTSLPSFYNSNSPGQLTGNYNYGTQDSTFHIIKSQNGYHLSAGVNYQYKLSKRWTIDAGLHFMFVTNKQKAGKFVDSTLDVSKAYDNNSGALSTPSIKMVAVPGYYQAGYSNEIRNAATLFELPVNINFVINPNAKTQFWIAGGGSYAHLFSSKWLLPDSKNNKLYYSKELLQKNIFNWQAAAGVTMQQGWQFGLQYQQSISPIADKNLQPKLYWKHFLLYTNIPLQHKNHSLTK